MMKKLFFVIAVLGFILALGTAGTSDLEAEIGVQLMTDTEFYTRIAISLVMLLCGSIGSKVMGHYKHTKPPYRAAQRAYKQHNKHSA